MVNYRSVRGHYSKKNIVKSFFIQKLSLVILTFIFIGLDVFAQAPTITLPTAASVTTTSATLGGTVTGTLTHRGTRWSTTSPVGTSNELEEASTTTGAFTQNRSGLPSASKVFFVAYARNGMPTAASSETTIFTEPIQLTGGQLTAASTNDLEITLSFPSADSWEGTNVTGGYVILRKAGSVPSLGTLADGAAPPADGVGDKIATITNGAATSFVNNTGLISNTDYYYTIIPFVWDGSTPSTYNYNTSSPVTSNDFTFSTEPGIHATGALTATPISSSQINLSFNSVTTSAISNAVGYIVLVKSSAIVATDLISLNDGSAPNAFGLFEAIINSTSTSTYSDITGLSANTTYHYAIIPYNRGTDDQTYNYLTTTGFPTGSATTLDISATVVPVNGGTAPVITSTILSAGTTLQVIAGFSITSEGTQTLSDIGFNYSGLSGQFTSEYLYRSASAGSIGSLLLTDNSPDGNFSLTSVSAGNKTINSTAVYYYLVVDVVNTATSSSALVTINPSSPDIQVSSGIVNSFTLNRTYSFATSQLSDITLTGGTTPLINYRTYVANSINNDQSNSRTLADFRIRDGGAVNDPDDKGMSVTSIQIQITNAGNLSQIALFDDNANIEIDGTEQTVSGSGTVTITFTPTTPISVADDDIFDINVRGTFKSAVTDKQSMQFSVTAATATSTILSGFSSVGSWASTQTANNTNIIEVAASKLVFIANPPSTPINTNFSLLVKAVDGNPHNNIDLDYIGKVDLTASGGTGTLSAGAQSLSPNLVAGQFNWTQLKITLASTYTLNASDDAYTGQANNPSDIGDASGSIIISSSASTITQPTDPLLCYGGPTSSKLLGNIVITETDPAGISGTVGTNTFSLILPSGFIFDQSVSTGLAVSGGSDLTSPSSYTYPGSNVVEFSFTLNGTSNTNSLTIGGLKILYPHPGTVTPPPTGSLSITRLGGTANIAGVTAGTILASVSASQTNPAVNFTVAALSGDVAVDPNTTNFNVNSPAVNLVGSINPGIFSGSGVTFSSPNYRFNPNSLTPGNYDIKYTQTTAANGCQSVAINTFVVFISGINNLNSTYCNNDPKSPTLTVSQTFINQRFGGTNWRFDNFVYYDPNGGGFTKITTPTNAEFDPSLPAYQSIVQYFGGKIPIGFAVCSVNALDGVPCTGNSTYGVYNTYQWVKVNPAPSVSFVLPSDIYIYCDDSAPIILSGSPVNSTDFLVDKFDASGGQGSSISHSLVSGKEIWLFSPTAVAGVTPSTSQTFNITYQYEEPATGCRNTFSRPITVHDRPTSVPAGDIIKSTSNPPSPSTTMQLCEGNSVGSFSATDATYTYRWYADPASAGTFKGTGTSFTPPIDNLTAGTNTFNVTRVRNGCESSINTPLALSVNVIATPLPPAANRNLSYCVGTNIPNNDLAITTATGTVKWYEAGNPVPVFTGTNPTAATLGIVNTAANIYNFELTQTEATGCEGPLLANRTKIKVEIKPLPNLIITPSIADVNKICTTGGVISFTATDRSNVASNGTWSGAGLGGVGVLNPFNALGKTELNPLTLTPQTYTLRYDYTNATTLCSSFKTIDFNILPTITPVITIGNVCDGSPAVIINNSLVNPSSSTSTIQFTEWTLGDGSTIASGLSSSPIPAGTNSGRTSGTYFSPKHIYPNVGTFQITGSMTTSDGCRYTFPVPPANIPVTVSPLPKINFTWKNVCRDGSTSTEFKAIETSTPKLLIANYAWNFKTQGLLTTTSEGSGESPIVKYNKDGTDSVRLIVTTSAQCRDTIKKIVYVVPKFKRIVTDTSYQQGFESGADSWIAGGLNSSWALGSPAGSSNGFVFKADALRGSNSWDTNLTGASNPNEKSWVMSQCFNFKGALKPAIKLDLWSDTPQGVEGAVLQYNENGNIEDDASWKVLGEVDKGSNWYDAQGIASSPGNQASGDVGWTGKYSNWKEAKYKLDELIGKDNIVFRIAFGGGPGRTDGLAFDNVFIGERSRIVLLENFTNSSATVAAHNTIYKNAGTAAELVKIQYHTAFPGTDPIHDLNPQMNNARPAFYGITQAPTMRIDGDYQSGPLLSWLPSLYDDRILDPSEIRIKILTTKQSSGEVKININLENITGSTVKLKDAHIFTAIVQQSVTSKNLLGNSGNLEFVFVAKEFLPSTSGKKITSDLLAGKTYKDSVMWNNLNGDAIVVFVQNIDGNNKNVYQAQINLTPTLPNLVTALENIIPDEISIYPNPASREFRVELPSQVSHDVNLNLVDQVGRRHHAGLMSSGTNTATVNVEQLSEGIYILEIGTTYTGIIRKKIMVVMKN